MFKKPRGRLIGGSLRSWYYKYRDFREAGQDIIGHVRVLCYVVVI